MKYIFLDVDGTLFSHKINDSPESAKRAIQQARKNGHKVFLCTGRSLAECLKYLHYEVDGFIFGAGSMIYADGKRIYDHPIKKEDIPVLKQLIHKHHMGYCCEGSAGAYCDEYGYACALEYFTGLETDKEKIIKNAQDNGFHKEDQQHEDDPIYKMCVYSANYDLFYDLEKDLFEPYMLTLSLKDEHRSNYVCEVTDKTINKGTGIQRILEHYHADAKDTIGIGDSSNDIPMLNACAIGIAMGNAFDELKEIADYVTTDILDDGIYNALKHYGVID